MKLYWISRMFRFSQKIQKEQWGRRQARQIFVHIFVYPRVQPFFYSFFFFFGVSFSIPLALLALVSSRRLIRFSLTSLFCIDPAAFSFLISAKTTKTCVCPCSRMYLCMGVCVCLLKLGVVVAKMCLSSL